MSSLHSFLRTSRELGRILNIEMSKIKNIFNAQCPQLNRITLGQRKSDNNNRMIQLTDVFCVLLRYNGTSIIWLQYVANYIIRDPIKRRAF